MSAELTRTMPRTGRRTRRCVCGKCRWWTGAHSSSRSSTWPARWRSHRASPLSPSVAIRIRAADRLTAKRLDSSVVLKGEGGRMLKGTLLWKKNKQIKWKNGFWYLGVLRASENVKKGWWEKRQDDCKDTCIHEHYYQWYNIFISGTADVMTL